MYKLIAALLLLSVYLGQNGNAIGQTPQGFQIMLTHENDFLTPANKDENYTGGIEMEILIPDKRNIKRTPFFKFKTDSSITVYRFSAGATAYTPQDLDTDQIVYGDRPYSSLLYGNLGSLAYSYKRDFRVQISSELILGAMGTPGPGNAQAFLHENHVMGSTRPIPLGWDNQISFDGKFVVNYNVRVQGLIGKNKFTTGSIKFFDPNWVARVDLGTYMVNLQGGFRLNLFNIGMSMFNDYNPGLPTILFDVNSLQSKETVKHRRIVRFNLFVEPSLRLAIYNASLEGAMFRDNSVYVIPHSQVSRILFEMIGGVNLILFNSFYLRYCYYGRSREFEGGKPYHNWGSVSIGYAPSRWTRFSGGD